MLRGVELVAGNAVTGKVILIALVLTQGNIPSAKPPRKELSCQFEQVH